MIERELFKLRQIQKARLGEKFLVKKKFLVLKPFKVIGKETIEQEERDYLLNVFAEPPTKTLRFHLLDCQDRTKYDAEASYSHIETKEKKINITYNIQLLSEYCETIIDRLYIVDHLLLLRENTKKDVGFQQRLSGKNYSLRKLK